MRPPQVRGVALGCRICSLLAMCFPEEDKTLYPPSIDLGEKDDDIYGLLGNSFPPLTLPTELILTDDNFDERIMQFDKTAVVFYLGCELLTKTLASEKLIHVHATCNRVSRIQAHSPSLDGCFRETGQK